MGEVTGDDHGSGQRELGANRMSGEFDQNVFHRPVQVDRHNLAAERRLIERAGRKRAGSCLSSSRNTPSRLAASRGLCADAEVLRGLPDLRFEFEVPESVRAPVVGKASR